VPDSTWDPQQYNRFAAEREQPFWDLCSLLEPTERPVVVDLGCGDGRLTAALHERLRASSTLGVDSSPAMFAEAVQHAGDGIRFVESDMSRWADENVDVIVSNAALHWVADHATVLARWRKCLAPGGQLAFQVPANADHPSHTVSAELASEWLGADAPADPVAENVLRPEQYSRLLYDLGLSRQSVRLQVYAHVLDSSSDVVEWVKGTSLTRFKSSITPGDFERFVEEYRRRLVAVLGDERPFFYPFKRILCWGRAPDR
jgi:trans-aconitate 2-methyltransferase